MKQSVLIIDDDATQRVMLDAFLHKKMNLKCYSAENGRKALEVLSNKPNISLVISDIEMPIMDGIETLKNIKQSYPDLPVIMLSGTQDTEQAVEAIKLGASDYIKKPYGKERMMITVQNVLKMQEMGQEIDRLQHDHDDRFQFRHMVGHDSGLKTAAHLGRKAAMIDLPTLINGETGTGKELFAKAIHGESNRSGGPFIAVNCGAIPSDLVESTLFGHEKGSFTGATESKIGKFREADGGTIFLDEIGDLPLEAQVKILRTLQEKEVEPVGASRSVKINVRIIAATHRHLEQDVRSGLFREDLFYRLNVLHIKLPNLKERAEDIPELAQHFMHKISLSANLPIKQIDHDTMQELQNYSWPGNVRQLENSLNRAFILGDRDTLHISDFDLQAFTKREEEKISPPSQTQYRTLAEMEKSMIAQALKTHDHNMTQTAKSLGMAKSTLYRKVREHKDA